MEKEYMENQFTYDYMVKYNTENLRKKHLSIDNIFIMKMYRYEAH